MNYWDGVDLLPDDLSCSESSSSYISSCSNRRRDNGTCLSSPHSTKKLKCSRRSRVPSSWTSIDKQIHRKRNRRKPHYSDLLGKTVLINNENIINKHSVDSSDEDTGSLNVLENGHVADFEFSQSPSSRNKSSQKSTIETGLRRKCKLISFSSVLSKHWQRRVLQLLSIFSMFIIFLSDETTKDQIDKDFNIRKEEELTDVRTVQSISGWHLHLMNPQDGKSVNGQNLGKIIRPKKAEANALSKNEPQHQHSDSFQSFSLTDDEIKKRIDETYRKYQARNVWPKISKPVLFAWAYLTLVVMNAIWTLGTNLFRQLTLYTRNKAKNLYSAFLSRYSHQHCT